MDIAEIVKENQLFNNLNTDNIRKIIKCSKAEVQNFYKGQVILEKGTKIKKLGIIIEGELNLVSRKYNGTRVIITSLGINDLFGEALIFSTDKIVPYDLVSSDKSKIVFIPCEFFINMCPHACSFHRKVTSNMLAVLSDKIIMLNNKINILNSETIKVKIAVYLLDIYKKNRKLIFDIPMKRQELADFLNIKRPSLSRELSNMQHDGIIDVYRSTVKILDLKRLYELSE